MYLPVLTTVFCFFVCEQLLKRKHDKCEAELNRLQAQVKLKPLGYSEAQVKRRISLETNKMAI